jgi:hypothetical protein
MFSLVVGLLALIAILIVLLMQLGVTREVVVLQEKVTVFSQLLLRPPVPSFLRGSLPKSAIPAVQAVGFRSDGPFVMVFMTPGCQGCLGLAEGLKEATATGLLPSEAITCFLAEGSAGSRIEVLLRASTPFVAEVSTGGIFRDCEVSATPTMLAINPDTWEVFGHSVGGDARWAVSKLQMTEQQQMLPTPTVGHPQTSNFQASN